MPSHLAKSARQTRRLAQGAGAVFSLEQAAALLPIRDRDARQWIRAHGLVRPLAGRQVVIWGELLDALAAGDHEPEPAEPALTRSVLPRASLEPIK